MTKIVVLDTGHGGRPGMADAYSGAVGFGLLENDLLLTIAQKRRDIPLNGYRGIKVEMTLNKDVSVALNERARILY